ncbi:uncharacterized protein LOC129190341 isoform X2 [Dunckerocampus dactyliophorus]|uniref:uncharacterized protein LOC129190341 isoform X2 n=1 Tax=Dunckerocampus dactyliophorus TaxID=161453 RepID=UPI002404A367|nr:uncharacterized protein LOC129190341 isoform X2 [Dunckerocampus dactyliophorus]
MSKEFIRQRLADEILGTFERSMASYEEELSRTREELERQQPQAVCQAQVVLHIDDVQQLVNHQEELPHQGWRHTFKQEDPQSPHVKVEEEELWTTQEGESLLGLDEAHLTKLPLTAVSVKTEDHEDKPPECSQFHHSPSEGNRGAQPASSGSPQHMTTEADGDHCGGSQADSLSSPSDLDDTTSHSPEDEDGDDTQEPLSSDTDDEVLVAVFNTASRWQQWDVMDASSTIDPPSNRFESDGKVKE